MAQDALQHFFDKMNQFQMQFAQLAEQQQRLKMEKDKLQHEISQQSAFQAGNLNEASLLSKHIAELKKAISASFTKWDAGVEKALPMQQLAETFQDRIIF